MYKKEKSITQKRNFFYGDLACMHSDTYMCMIREILELWLR